MIDEEDLNYIKSEANLAFEKSIINGPPNIAVDKGKVNRLPIRTFNNTKMTKQMLHGDIMDEEIVREPDDDDDDEDNGNFDNFENDMAEDLEDEYKKNSKLVFDDNNLNEVKELLPIKTSVGLVPRATKMPKAKKIKLDNSVTDVIEEDKMDTDNEANDSDAEILEQKVKHKNEKIISLSTADLLIEREEEIQKQKFRIGVICSGILEKPEEKIKNLGVLLDMIDEYNKEEQLNLLPIRKLAMVSLVEIFKDIIPEYRVGIVDLEAQKVKKTTLARITYENDMLAYYKRYLTKLEKISASLQQPRRYGPKKPHASIDERKLGIVAITCLIDALLAHPYFNFSTNIAQLLVALLNNNNENVRISIEKCFVSLFKSDKRMDISRHVVRHINQLVKKKSNNVHVEVLSCLTALQIKSINLDAEKENEIKQKKLEAHKSRIVNLSKRERKRKKKLAEIEKELLETKAEENKQTKNAKLTDITKLLFTIYFRILKQNPNAKILSITLEGLAKFAHVINIEYFSDLIEVLCGLLTDSDLGYREQLHCIQTVFTILSGQGEVLNIDPARFYTHLYKNLLHVNGGKNHEDLEAILRTLENVLIKRRKNITYHRYLAFIKRLLTLSIQVQHNGALGVLAIVKTAMQLQSSLDILLDTETTVGSGYFDPYAEEPEFCNANCTNLYELSLLHRHYHPTVKKFATHLACGVPAVGVGMLNPEISKL